MSKPKPATPAAPATPSESPSSPPPTIRTLKIATCPSLSGQSQLTYHIGCNAESHILFRITGNSGAGIFGNEWIALANIQQAFDAIPPDKPLRSALLQPLYQTKSSNTPAFLLAALLNEGLVVATENQGYYQRTDPGSFMAELSALADSGVDLNANDKPEKPAKKKPAQDAKPLPG